MNTTSSEIHVSTFTAHPAGAAKQVEALIQFQKLTRENLISMSSSTVLKDGEIIMTILVVWTPV